MSYGQQITVGTGFYVPAGVLHAPGSMCTYEPQKASDVFGMYESWVNGQFTPKELLWKNVPKDKLGDVDYLMAQIDWKLNVDPNFVKNHSMSPKPVKPLKEMEKEGYIESWITYRCPEFFSAKELTVLPGATVTIRDSACYGFITMQGHGRFGAWDISSPNMIYFGQDTYDEFFVTEDAAKKGIKIHNHDQSEPLVLLKHFGPENPDLNMGEVVRKISIPRNYVGQAVINRMAA